LFVLRQTLHAQSGKIVDGFAIVIALARKAHKFANRETMQGYSRGNILGRAFRIVRAYKRQSHDRSFYAKLQGLVGAFSLLFSLTALPPLRCLAKLQPGGDYTAMPFVVEMNRALVIEDQDLMRLTVMEIVEEHFQGCNVQGAQTLEGALAIMRRDRFDLVIIDPGLPGFNPNKEEDRLSVVSQAVKASPGAKHIVLTGTDSEAEAATMQQLGIDGYAAKIGLSRIRLKEVLAEVAPNSFTLQLADISSQRRHFGLGELTRRERQVMELMMDRPKGQKRKEVYQKMATTHQIDASTAEQYFKSAVRK
jgi:DNA-binding NarL/FixJ family response regulator